MLEFPEQSAADASAAVRRQEVELVEGHPVRSIRDLQPADGVGPVAVPIPVAQDPRLATSIDRTEAHAEPLLVPAIRAAQHLLRRAQVERLAEPVVSGPGWTGSQATSGRELGQVDLFYGDDGSFLVIGPDYPGRPARRSPSTKKSSASRSR